MMKKIYVLVFFLLLANIHLKAQGPDMITDRPDQTESAYVVPKGWVQWETGFLYEKFSSEVKNYAYNTSLVRFGLFNILELRAGFSYLGTRIKTDHFKDTESGFGPLSLGIKTILLERDESLPQLALVGTLTIPNTGASVFERDHLGGEFRLSTELPISEVLTLGTNIGAIWSGVEGEDFATGIYTFVVGMSITERLSGFGELYGYFPGEGPNDHRWDMGITHKATDNLQLDLSFGIGLNDTAPDHFISFGFSVRMP